MLGSVIVAVTLVATLRVTVFTASQIPRATTAVPWFDQWVMVDELRQHESGRPLWPIRWEPYWGHRLVIPHLIFLANE